MTTKTELYATFQAHCKDAQGKTGENGLSPFMDTPFDFSAYGLAVILLGLFSTGTMPFEGWKEHEGRLFIFDTYRPGWGRAEPTGGVTLQFVPATGKMLVVNVPAGYGPAAFLRALQRFIQLIRTR